MGGALKGQIGSLTRSASPVVPAFALTINPFARNHRPTNQPRYLAHTPPGIELPSGCKRSVLNALLMMCNDVVTIGVVASKVAANGMLVVVGDAERLMDGSLGDCGDPRRNRFAHMHITVFDFFTNTDARKEILSCGIMEKAMVFCGKTGRLLANKFGIASIEKGDTRGSTKLRAVSAIAQEGFISIMCSKDICMPGGEENGAMQVFPGTMEHVAIPKVRCGAVAETGHSRLPPPPLTIPPTAQSHRSPRPCSTPFLTPPCPTTRPTHPTQL